MNNHPFLNESRCLSGGNADECRRLSAGAALADFGLSSGAGLSTCEIGMEFSASRAQSLRLMERIASRGGVLLNDGRRYAAAATLALAVAAATPYDTAFALDIPAGGTGTVSAGESVTSITVGSGGSLNVQSTGSAYDAQFAEDGKMFISGGGYASNNTFSEGGSQYVDGTASDNTFSSGGYQDVAGTASGNTFRSGGEQTVSGTASDNTFSEGGSQYVYAAGTANDNTFRSGGYQIVSGTASDNTFSEGGVQDVQPGGTASDNTFSSGGEQYVIGTASGNTFSEGGEQYVQPGGTASDNTFSSGGYQNVDGTASNNTFSSGGSQYVRFGGTASDNTFSSGGSQYVRFGGTASGNTFSSGGEQNVSGTASSNTFSSGGLQNVSGTASGNTFSSGGTQYVSAAGTASDNTFSERGIQFVSGTASGNTFNSGGAQHVYAGGTASDNTFSSGGTQIVRAGGTASNNTFSSGGYQDVWAGGTASDNTFSSGGYQDVRAGGTASNNTFSSGGEQYVSNGGSADSTTIDGGGAVYHYSGGTVTNLTLISGTHYLEGASVSGYSYSSGNTQVIRSGGTAIDTTLDGGTQHVSSGLADGTVIDGGGSQVVYAGGVASDAHVSSGGSMIMSGGSVAGSAYFERANDLYGPSGEILSGGVLVFEDGSGAVVSTVLSGAGGIALSGGTLTMSASNTFSGANSIYDGALSAGMNDALGRGGYTILGSGELYVGGTTQTIAYLSGGGSTTLDSGGSLTIDQDIDTVYSGQISGANGGGTLVKNSFGTITLVNAANSLGSLTVNGGGVMIGAGGAITVASGTTVNDGGWFGGEGTLIGGMSFGSGGVFAPAGVGASVGEYVSGAYVSQTISGNLTLDAGAVYQVRVDHQGNTTDTDSASVTGTATFASGAVVQHVAGGGLDASVADSTKQWTILAASSVVGNVDDIETKSNLLFLAPVLSLDGTGTSILMSFERIFTFTDFGDTPNQIAVAGGLASLDPTGPLASTIVAGVTVDTDVGMLYNQLSGEMHASLAGGLLLLDRDFSRWILDRSGRKSLAGTILSASVPSFESAKGYASIHPRAMESRFANNFWADVGYARQGVDGDGNAGRYTLKGPEVSLGYDHIAPSGWIGGIAFRYGDREMKVNSRLSEADIDSYSIAAYGGFQSAFGPGAARLVLGGAYTRHEIDGKRHVDIGAIRQRLDSDYHANSYQLFMEGAYAIPLGRVWLEPFVDLAWTSMRVPGFTETGGNARLDAHSQSQNNLSQLLGVRLVLPTFCRINVEAQAGWRHTYGKLDKASAFSFAEGGSRFGIKGSKLNRDEAVLDLRADYEIRDNLRVGLEANAAVGERGTALRGGAFIALEW